MARATTDLILDWSDERARGIAADNLFLDESLEERKASMTRLRAGLGTCKLGQLDAENAAVSSASTAIMVGSTSL
jgi:hypothetical protein